MRSLLFSILSAALFSSASVSFAGGSGKDRAASVWFCSAFCAHYYMDRTLIMLYQPPFHAYAEGPSPLSAYNTANKVCQDTFGGDSFLARAYETTTRPGELAVPVSVAEACIKVE